MRSPRTMKIIKKIHKANENVQNALSTRVKYIGSEYPSDYLIISRVKDRSLSLRKLSRVPDVIQWLWKNFPPY